MRSARDWVCDMVNLVTKRTRFDDLELVLSFGFCLHGDDFSQAEYTHAVCTYVYFLPEIK